MVCCDACQRWVHCQCDGIRFVVSFVIHVNGFVILFDKNSIEEGRKKDSCEMKLGSQSYRTPLFIIYIYEYDILIRLQQVYPL